MSDAVTMPSGPSTMWSIAAAIRRPLWRVRCTSVARSSCSSWSSASSGAASAAAARGSSLFVAPGSLATSEDWTTTRSGSSSSALTV